MDMHVRGRLLRCQRYRSGVQALLSPYTTMTWLLIAMLGTIQPDEALLVVTDDFTSDSYEMNSYGLCLEWADYIEWEARVKFPELRVMASCVEVK